MRDSSLASSSPCVRRAFFFKYPFRLSRLPSTSSIYDQLNIKSCKKNGQNGSWQEKKNKHQHRNNVEKEKMSNAKSRSSSINSAHFPFFVFFLRIFPTRCHVEKPERHLCMRINLPYFSSSPLDSIKKKTEYRKKQCSM